MTRLEEIEVLIDYLKGELMRMDGRDNDRTYTDNTYIKYQKDLNMYRSQRAYLEHMKEDELDD